MKHSRLRREVKKDASFRRVLTITTSTRSIQHHTPYHAHLSNRTLRPSIYLPSVHSRAIPHQLTVPLGQQKWRRHSNQARPFPRDNTARQVSADQAAAQETSTPSPRRHTISLRIRRVPHHRSNKSKRSGSNVNVWNGQNIKDEKLKNVMRWIG